ncbi:hypothetical protein HELRODRAFT_159103 [Helobdella robusta]|uniref:Uncharacterized protein n=1 Tax=Helobdella robusta TaxID=6412 RepID=T1ENL4_HELRO|nr:hypothetical protein HELRODRAFT_159103 [Helobdella robusta]ESO12545.1 hypothetical protein HELRODRAFT_159103 [Helobdella robusta]
MGHKGHSKAVDLQLGGTWPISCATLPTEHADLYSSACLRCGNVGHRVTEGANSCQQTLTFVTKRKTVFEPRHHVKAARDMALLTTELHRCPSFILTSKFVAEVVVGLCCSGTQVLKLRVEGYTSSSSSEMLITR